MNVPITTLDPTLTTPRDAKGFAFLAHIEPPPSVEEANFTRLSAAELDADLDAAHAARAEAVAHVPAGQQATHVDTAGANRQWAIAAKRAQAFWEARRDHFYLVHLGKAYPGMLRPPKGSFQMNEHEHGSPPYMLRSHALEHAKHWVVRNHATMLLPVPSPPQATAAQIKAAKDKIIDRMVAEELRKKGLTR